MLCLSCDVMKDDDDEAREIRDLEKKNSPKGKEKEGGLILIGASGLQCKPTWRRESVCMGCHHLWSR